MVADALVYHPTVAHYLKFVALTGKRPGGAPRPPPPPPPPGPNDRADPTEPCTKPEA
jgi:hypothetical protein